MNLNFRLPSQAFVTCAPRQPVLRAEGSCFYPQATINPVAEGR